MTDRRGSRFLLEVAFLAALAAGLAFAELSRVETGAIMLLGWLIVAVLEWAAWRAQPHFGSGLPPRYYVPQLALPPARPLEQVLAGYPDATRDEAPTWIASAALRAEVLGEWPHAVPAPAAPHAPLEDTAPELGDTERGDTEPEPDDEVDSWTLVELPPALDELEPAPPAEAVRGPEPEPRPEPEREPAPVAAVPSAGTARYRVEPLGEPARRGAFRRVQVASIEVPARPRGVRPLPGERPEAATEA